MRVLLFGNRQADLCLCLGTSLQIMPCGGMPMLTKKNAGMLVIVNLQTTRLDKQCDLRIHAYVDDVMIGVRKELLKGNTKNIVGGQL